MIRASGQGFGVRTARFLAGRRRERIRIERPSAVFRFGRVPWGLAGVLLTVAAAAFTATGVLADEGHDHGGPVPTVGGELALWAALSLGGVLLLLGASRGRRANAQARSCSTRSGRLLPNPSALQRRKDATVKPTDCRAFPGRSSR